MNGRDVTVGSSQVVSLAGRGVTSAVETQGVKGHARGDEHLKYAADHALGGLSIRKEEGVEDTANQNLCREGFGQNECVEDVERA